MKNYISSNMKPMKNYISSNMKPMKNYISSKYETLIKKYSSSEYKTFFKKFILIILVLMLVILAFVLGLVNINFDIFHEMWSVKDLTLTPGLRNLHLKGYSSKMCFLGIFVLPCLYVLCYITPAFTIFLIVNLKLWIFIALAYIFVKCLLTNFYEKHFKFKSKFLLWNKNLIKIIWQKKEIIATFFLKLLIFMLPIRILIRMCAFWIFSNDYNNMYSSFVLILLCLPFVYYFLNIITEYLKNNKTEEKNYSLFNDYVIKNINLYNISYIISSIILINLYFIYCFILFIILIVLTISFLVYSKFNSISLPPPPDSNNTNNPCIMLQATFPPITGGWLTTTGALGLHLCTGATAECASLDSLTDSALIREKSWDYYTFVKNTIEANNLNTNNRDQGLVSTTNWLHKDISSLSKDDNIESSMDKTISILKSPILRMVYGQKKYIESDIAEKDLGETAYEPQTLFINDKFIGSVGMVRNTLVVNFIKAGDSTLKDKTFVPTHYIQNDSLRAYDGEMEPIIRTIKFLEGKYGIFIPNKERVANIITLTEIEAFDNPNFGKVFRPCINYTDLDSRFKKVEKYYQCKKTDPWNPQVDDKNIFNRVHYIKSQVHSSTVENDIKLNKLYIDYFKTRMHNYKEDFADLRVEPRLYLPTIRGEFFYKCTAIALTNQVWFRDDDLLIYTYNDYEFIDMATTRDRLVERLKGRDISIKCYVVCANQISFEMLCIENPNFDKNIDELPLIYSVIDRTNLKYNKVYNREVIKSIYNVLNRQDGYTLKSFVNCL